MKFHVGKVRNSYLINDDVRIIETTDRISAFDSILPFLVPGKGKILQAISSYFFEHTRHIVDNHFLGSLSTNFVLVKNAQVFPLEVVVRGVLTGSLWRLYQEGRVEEVYHVKLPTGLKENDELPVAIITPTTKADEGHDVPITCEQAALTLENLYPGLGKSYWKQIEGYALSLFDFGAQYAKKKNLLLADTKYEFGLCEGKVILVDEIHTPDSSRYLSSTSVIHLSKEALRSKLASDFDVTSPFTKNSKWQENNYKRDLSKSVLSIYSSIFEKLFAESPEQMCKNTETPWPIDEAVVTDLSKDLTYPQNVCVVGDGGRDYTLFNCLSKLQEVASVFCAPGNRFWGKKYQSLTESSPEKIAEAVFKNNIEFVISGPENYLAKGLYDACKKVGVTVLGPDAQGSRLEVSKILCKEIILSAKVKTAESYILAHSKLDETLPLPCVIKYDGLAAGKGVFVVKTPEDLKEAIEVLKQNVPSWHEQMLELPAPSYSKQKKEPFHLIENLLEGKEISAIALCQGDEFKFLPFARDYKRRNDNDKGPNTGGMGAIAPVAVSSNVMDAIKDAFSKTLTTLKENKTPYSGFLFGGFMIAPNEDTYLIEFNCRLGDPETQVILPGLGREFWVDVLRTAKGKPFIQPTHGSMYEYDTKKRVYVVGASPEYPNKSAPRRFIKRELCHVNGFVPTSIEENLSSTGGRAFGVLGEGNTYSEARKNAYEAINDISYADETKPHYRKDIGAEF